MVFNIRVQAFVLSPFFVFYKYMHEAADAIPETPIFFYYMYKYRIRNQTDQLNALFSNKKTVALQARR